MPFRTLAVSRRPLVFGAAIMAVALVSAAFGPSASSAATPDAGAPIPIVRSGAPTAAAAGSTQPNEVADNRLLVSLDPGTSADAAADVAGTVDATDAELVGSTLAVELPAGETAAAASALRADDRVQFVQPNYLLHGFATTNDPLLPAQYGLADPASGGISATSAWKTTIGSSNVVIGVLDSGIDLDHPDLVGNLWTNRTGIQGCGYGTHGYNALTQTCNPNDDAGHGSHVAGIAAARGNNGIGVSGVNVQGSLMALKMLDSEGNGDTFSAIRAIDWAIRAKDAGVNLRVLVASWGASSAPEPPGTPDALADAIADAGAHGILFVTAAGNAGDNVDSGNTEYPCAFPLANIVCVAASNTTGALATEAHNDSFNSNFGAASVDLAAPGVDIGSTVPPGVVLGCGSSGYCGFSGTSMATPFVAGGAALVLAAEPNLTVAQLKARLLGAVDLIPSLAGQVVTGGRFDVCKAMPGCGTIAPSVPTAPRDLNVAVGHGEATVTWSAPASNGNGVGVTSYTVTTTTPVQSTTVTGGSVSVALTDNTNAGIAVTAANAVGSSTAALAPARARSGGYEVDGFGGTHSLRIMGGPVPSAATGGPYWPGWDIARGVAVLPNGTGGYVLDGFGGLHPFAIGGNPKPPAVTGAPYWLGWDIARDVAILPNGKGGLMLDAYGGLHPFGIGDQAVATAARSGPAWPGWDIARGVTITADSRGGYVLDGLGGAHPFSVGKHPVPAAAVGGPTFPGPIARGITLVGGGGWILDGFGGVHGFHTTGSVPAGPTNAPIWPGWDIARGLRV